MEGNHLVPASLGNQVSLLKVLDQGIIQSGLVAKRSWQSRFRPLQTPAGSPRPVPRTSRMPPTPQFSPPCS